jgi:hypothetical protein
MSIDTQGTVLDQLLEQINITRIINSDTSNTSNTAGTEAVDADQTEDAEEEYDLNDWLTVAVTESTTARLRVESEYNLTHLHSDDVQTADSDPGLQTNWEGIAISPSFYTNTWVSVLFADAAHGTPVSVLRVGLEHLSTSSVRVSVSSDQAAKLGQMASSLAMGNVTHVSMELNADDFNSGVVDLTVPEAELECGSGDGDAASESSTESSTAPSVFEDTNVTMVFSASPFGGATVRFSADITNPLPVGLICTALRLELYQSDGSTDNDDRGTSLAVGVLRGPLRIPSNTVGRVVLYIDVPYSVVRATVPISTPSILCRFNVLCTHLRRHLWARRWRRTPGI